MYNEVKSAGRVLDVLELFATTRDPMSVTQVARNLDIPKSSAQGLLATLTGRGYSSRVGTGYVLAAELRTDGWIGGSRTRLLAAARPVLDRMSLQSGESAFIGVLAGNEIKYLAKSLSAHDVRYDVSLSHPRPVYCTSSGIAILAHKPVTEAQAILAEVSLRAITPDTVTSPAGIANMLERARRAGYAEIHDANVLGASGVAAPVFGCAGQVLGALSIGAPTARYKQLRKSLIGVVVHEAATLSRRMGVLTANSAESEPSKRSRSAA